MRRAGAWATVALLALAASGGAGAGTNPKTGRVFVFSGASGALIRTLSDPVAMNHDQFGASLAGLGDVDGDGVPDLAVGAPGVNEPGAVKAGRVFIFSGQSGGLLSVVSAPAPVRHMKFGWSIAATGDLDGDGAGDLVVGAPRARGNGPKRPGEAYLVSGADGSILATLSAPVPRAGARFGWSVAGGGDADGDGKPDVLVGAPREKARHRSSQGRVYLLDASGALLADFDDPVRQEKALFGDSVAFMPDADGDGIDDILAGADGQDVISGDFAGRVFILRGTDPNNPLIADRTAPSPERQANFGFAVAGIEDLDGDGRGDLVATSPDHSGAEVYSGGAFALSGDPNLAVRSDYLLAQIDDPDPVRYSVFGGSVAAAPDFTGDGLAEILVGAEIHKDASGLRSGRVYVIEAVSGNVYLSIDSPTGDTCSRFGWSVASIGDVDGDSIGDLAVGAPRHRAVPSLKKRRCF